MSESERKRGLVMAMGMLGGLVLLDETILGVSLPTIRSELGFSATTAHWILNSYMLTFTCFAAIGGKAIDLFGLRPALIISCSAFAAASFLAGFADGAAMLIAMRIIQGLCAAIIFPMTMAATTLSFDETERGRAIGILAGTATIFLAAGPLLGGILTDFLSWRWVFWINIPVVIAGGTLTCLLWRKPVRDVVRPKIDRIGLVLLLVGLASLVFGWMEGPDIGWATPVIFGSLIIGILGLGAFVTYETRQANPLIDVRLFRLRAFNASILVVLLAQMSKICVAIFVPYFLQFDLHYTALWAGIGTVVAVFPSPFLSTPAGQLADKHGSRRPVLISLAVLALANLLIGGTMLLQSYSIFALPLLLWGIALPFAMIPAGRLTANAVPAEKQGEISGLVITARLVGGTLGVTMGSVLIAMNFSFSAIFWVLATLLAAGTAYCLYALENDNPKSFSESS